MSYLEEYRKKYADKQSEAVAFINYQTPASSLLHSPTDGKSANECVSECVSEEVSVRPKTAFELLKQKSLEEWEEDVTHSHTHTPTSTQHHSDSDDEYFKHEPESLTQSLTHSHDDHHVHFDLPDTPTPTPSQFHCTTSGYDTFTDVSSPLVSEQVSEVVKEQVVTVTPSVPATSERVSERVSEPVTTQQSSKPTASHKATTLVCSKCHKLLSKSHFSKTQLTKRKTRPGNTVTCKVCTSAH